MIYGAAFGRFRITLGISYRDHVTNDEERNIIRHATAPYKDLLTFVRRHNLTWYGHITKSTGLAQGTVQGGRRKGQTKNMKNNITDWTGLKLGGALRKAENREGWRKMVARSSLVPQRSSRWFNAILS